MAVGGVKLDLTTRTAINASWFNFFMCSYNGTVTLPATDVLPGTTNPQGEAITIPRTESGAEGCN